MSETISVLFAVSKPKKPVVRKIAIGSLLPDSNSRSGLSGFFRLIRFDLKIANTAAASVDETIEPSNIPSRIEILRI